MPTEEYCPVVRSYLVGVRTHLERIKIPGLHDEIFDQLEELKEYALTQPYDLASQRVRAFFCLRHLFVLLSTRIGGSIEELPSTREGIQNLIQFCSKIRDEEELKLYVRQLDPNRDPGIPDIWEQISKESLFGITDVIVSSAEYLRPRLHNGKSLAGMGSRFAQGLAEIRTTSDNFVKYGQVLISVSIHNKGGLVT